MYRNLAHRLRPEIVIGEATPAEREKLRSMLSKGAAVLPIEAKAGELATGVHYLEDGVGIADGSSFVSLQYVARHGRRVVGSTSLGIKDLGGAHEKQFWLYRFFVALLYRRMGIGELLTEYTVKRAKEFGALSVFLYVETDNTRAIRTYQKMKYHIIGVDTVDGSRCFLYEISL
jgi:ribosomal-protein-alanine N-acetyltransferase